MKARLNYFPKAPELMQSVLALNKAVEECGLEPGLLHLIKLRASQINGCSYCVDMHAHEALADGDSQQRVIMVAAWKESPLFTERERVAFAWTEAVTEISRASVPDDLYARVLGEFTEAELVKLAEAAGLAADRGILVNAQMETAMPGIFAAGDVARWSGAEGGAGMRVEHWVVAERQGQVAAQNMLGAGLPFMGAPFFWSIHYDMAIRYVGHAEGWDEVVIDGDIAARDAAISYRKGGQVLAVATIGRDIVALEHGQHLSGAI